MGHELKLIFSWREPKRFKDLISTGWSDDFPNPMPPVLDQKHQSTKLSRRTCNAHALHAVLTAQYAILSAREGRDRPYPALSLSYLIDETMALPATLRFHTETFLKHLSKKGILSEEDYNLHKDLDGPGVRARFKFDEEIWRCDCYKIFDQNLREAVLRGPQLAGFLGTTCYSIQGQNNAVLYDPSASQPKYYSIGSDKKEHGGHSICVTGYGEDWGKKMWEYLNSWGPKFGRDDGYGEIVKKGITSWCPIELDGWR